MESDRIHVLCPFVFLFEQGIISIESFCDLLDSVMTAEFHGSDSWLRRFDASMFERDFVPGGVGELSFGESSFCLLPIARHLLYLTLRVC